jgi:phosphatidylglycerophosphate synthase
VKRQDAGWRFEDTKQSRSLLSSIDHRVARGLIPLIPACLQSHHLTLLTFVWTALALAASILARVDVRWLWAVSATIVLQYVTDALDGKVGKMRGTGLVRWGYYMDHLLDYVFLCTLLIGYMLLLPDRFQYLMALVIVLSAAFMISSFLARSVTGVLTISFMGVGAIEMRLIFIGINTWVVTVGTAKNLTVVPYAMVVAAGVLGVMVYRTQRALWLLDLAELQSPACEDRTVANTRISGPRAAAASARSARAGS